MDTLFILAIDGGELQVTLFDRFAFAVVLFPFIGFYVAIGILAAWSYRSAANVARERKKLRSIQDPSA